jgi:hypothetical protein
MLSVDKTLEQIDAEYERDSMSETARQDYLLTAHPRLVRIPIVGQLVTSLYSHGMGYIFALVCIVIFFTVIKMPYFGVPFTGQHASKYNTYVESAMYMTEHNNPLWYQLRYVANPLHNPDGIRSRFNLLPVLEWGLFMAYEFLPFGSLEVKTRLVTHIIGILILICGYVFFAKWVPKNMALLITGLMAVNPVVHLATFVTVGDSVAIVLMFLSLSLLSDYFKSRDIRTLCWAGLVFGLGTSVKYSLFLWLAPIAGVLIWYRSDSVERSVRDAGLYVGVSLLPVVMWRTTVQHLPGSPIFGMVGLGLWAIAYALLYKVLPVWEAGITYQVYRLLRAKLALACVGLSVVGLGLGVTQVLGLHNYADNFLTDGHLLFNYKLYKYMVWHQLKEYMTPIVFKIGMLAIAILALAKESRVKHICLAFCCGSLVYWVVASKAIFFHVYYTLIIMITFSLLAATAIYYVMTAMDRPLIKGLFLLFFGALIVPRTLEATAYRLGTYEDISEVIAFVLNNTQRGDIIIHEGYYTPVTIYTGRPFVRAFQLADDKFRRDVREMGFAAAMAKYRVKYLFTPYAEPSYRDFAELIEDAGVRGSSYDRNYAICEKVGTKCEESEKVYRRLDDIVTAKRIKDKFRLEKKVGKFSFYRFVD